MLSPATAAVPAIVPPVPSSASLLWIFLVMACISPKTVQKYRYCLSAQYLTCRRPRARCQGAQMTDLQPFPAKLTARQQQILDLIQSAIARTGAPPTRAEIAAELGFKSANAAEEHLQALARKGVIELVSGTSRGIRLCGETVRNINAVRGTQFSLPIPGLSQLTLPLIGRVAAGSVVVYRFRTTRAPDDAPNGDPRLTPFGAFLRRNALDELPQFVNVLQGRMSIVGPPAHADKDQEIVQRLVRACVVRHRARPGITGWAQVNGHRGDADTAEKVQARVDRDLEYLRRWSLGLDLRIIARTVKSVLLGRSA